MLFILLVVYSVHLNWYRSVSGFKRTWTLVQYFLHLLVFLATVSFFTLPKIYTVYKVQIDGGLMKVHDMAVDATSR